VICKRTERDSFRWLGESNERRGVASAGEGRRALDGGCCSRNDRGQRAQRPGGRRDFGREGRIGPKIRKRRRGRERSSARNGRKRVNVREGQGRLFGVGVPELVWMGSGDRLLMTLINNKEASYQP
jgi:hypothetical protein